MHQQYIRITFIGLVYMSISSAFNAFISSAGPVHPTTQMIRDH